MHSGIPILIFAWQELILLPFFLLLFYLVLIGVLFTLCMFHLHFYV